MPRRNVVVVIILKLVNFLVFLCQVANACERGSEVVVLLEGQQSNVHVLKHLEQLTSIGMHRGGFIYGSVVRSQRAIALLGLPKGHPLYVPLLLMCLFAPLLEEERATGHEPTAHATLLDQRSRREQLGGEAGKVLSSLHRLLLHGERLILDALIRHCLVLVVAFPNPDLAVRLFCGVEAFVDQLLLSSAWPTGPTVGGVVARVALREVSQGQRIVKPALGAWSSAFENDGSSESDGFHLW